jgi:hypothetical protein
MSLKDKLQQSKGGAKKTWTSSKGEKAHHNYGVKWHIFSTRLEQQPCLLLPQFSS